MRVCLLSAIPPHRPPEPHDCEPVSESADTGQRIVPDRLETHPLTLGFGLSKTAPLTRGIGDGIKYPHHFGDSTGNDPIWRKQIWKT